MQEKTLLLIPAACIYVLFSSVLWAATPIKAELDNKFSKLVKNGSVTVASDKWILYRYPPKQNSLLVPASVQKYATALAALHYFGSQFRFSTEFYMDQNNELGIRGHGDPFLVSEEWQKIAAQLSDLPTVPKISQGLFFDTSLFEENIQIPGLKYSLNPYDARNGALVVNFNTVNLKVDKNGAISSAEEQTPLTPFAKHLGKKLPSGIHRVSIPPDSGFAYAGELLQTIFLRHGLSFKNRKVSLRQVSSAAQLVYRHYNNLNLQDLIAGMMLYSNNFTANQLLLTTGMKRFGSPASLKKGRLAVEEYLTKELGISADQFRIAEGSGISRKNRLTPDAVLLLLKAFVPYQHLLPREKKIPYKTGTLRGVYSMAGYLSSDDPLYFVILLNQKKNHREKIRDILLKTDFSSF
ncbi:MAG: D-alanyl-D-alanine carboxypeptidase [SAR324 cluster bacterium]|nr:D-alanyl-D-alanine carboxypeptidase [SAR324 cluster bacterium]